MKEQPISDISDVDSTGDNEVKYPKDIKGSKFRKYYHDFFNDKFVAEVVYPFKHDGYFVDCGACDGILFSQSKSLEDDGWKGICIEPNWAFIDDLEKNRKCKVSRSAIVPREYQGEHSFYQGDAHTLSHLILKADEMHKESYKVGGQDIHTILKEHKAPKFIEFMGIDIEGSFGDSFSIEERMLKELLESKDYTVGFFAVEHYWPPTVDSIFDSYDYVRVYNPYLKGLWLDQETGLSYSLSPWGNFICQQTGEEKKINVNHLKRIEWECYYVHLDVLKENKVLKRFLTP